MEKTGDRGFICMFIGYANDHKGNCYCMWNPVMGRVTEIQDVIFLQQMDFEKANCAKTNKEPIVVLEMA